VPGPSSQPLLRNRLDIHDRKQFEIKLEYQPSGADPKSKYHVETYLFLPASLNIDAETYPRAAFYADIHNYIRLKTPVMGLAEILSSEDSPLVRLEAMVAAAKTTAVTPKTPAELVYQAKLLSCVFRGALRRIVHSFNDEVRACAEVPSAGSAPLSALIDGAIGGVTTLVERFRALVTDLAAFSWLDEKSRASLRLVDEYISLSIEQFFRKAVADMDRLPRAGGFVEVRRALMALVLREEAYRKANQLRSLISPTGDNEEYMHRIGFLKKFCMNILFLAARREQKGFGMEEVLFAIAAGLAMAFATAVAFWAQARFTQVSLNFFLILVVGYMMKDRIKEGLRKIFVDYASRHLYDRSTRITDPVTHRVLGKCREKVDYGIASRVPEEILKLRRTDDFVTVSQGELSETVIRYQKQIVLNSDLLPRRQSGITGVTDIIRLNVERLLRDMDDPEYALEYVDLEDFSVGRVKAAKRYQVDLAFRFTVDDADQKKVSLQLVRLVLDRNGIKRMLRFHSEAQSPSAPVRSIA
jgi:hypothetical protein